MITRDEYLKNSEELHRSYYGQMVTEQVRDMVRRAFGQETLRAVYAQGDTYFNSIALLKWDVLASYVNRESFKTYGDFYSLAGGVCVCKEAARQLATEV